MTPRSPPRPFGPTSLTGVEVELVAPPGGSRAELARALCAHFRGAHVEYGYKFIDGGPVPDGRPYCEVTPACRVVDASGVQVTLVDDLSITEEVAAQSRVVDHRLVMDDYRLAAWVERNGWSRDAREARRLGPLRECFEARLHRPGEGCFEPQHRLLTDPQGHRLAVLAPYEAGRLRVAELVTRPLRRAERRPFLDRVLSTARALGFVVPSEGGVHVHFDRAPWRDGGRLAQLISDYARERPRLLRALAPNPRSRKFRGPFPRSLVRSARRVPPGATFDEAREHLNGRDIAKLRDFNLVWVFERWPRLPTLEFRALRPSMDAEAILGQVEVVEAFLTGVAQRADERSRAAG